MAQTANKPGKTVSFTVPPLPRPNIPKPPSRPPRTRGGFLLTVAVVAAIFGFGGAWLANHQHGQGGLVTSGLGDQKRIVTKESQLISQIAKTVGPSVVSVNVSITNASSGTDFFGFAAPSQEAQAAGTGIIVSSNVVMTNRHVVPAGTTNVSITLSDGTELKDVTVIGRTTDTDSLDVAFLKINDTKGHKLTPAAIGDSSKVQVGDNVVAIGNALGQFQNTVTSGIISGYGRSVQAGDSSGQQATENLNDLFQTDAAINEGNSGGPLVNLNGQVIGMNTATASSAQNIGFAIPIDNVKGLIEQVLKTGKFQRPYLGIHYISLTADVAQSYNLSTQQGAFIAPSSDASSPSVIPGSPAESAGLKERDIITAVDNQKVDPNHSLTSYLSKHQPGDSVDLTIVRAGKTIHARVTLGVLPTNQSS